MTDMLLEHDNEHEQELSMYFKDLRGLLSPSNHVVRDTLRRLFRDGTTMMMLSPLEFEFLEQASTNNEEFCVIVKDREDTLCILSMSEVTW